MTKKAFISLIRQRLDTTASELTASEIERAPVFTSTLAKIEIREHEKLHLKVGRAFEMRGNETVAGERCRATVALSAMAEGWTVNRRAEVSVVLLFVRTNK